MKTIVKNCIYLFLLMVISSATAIELTVEGDVSAKLVVEQLYQDYSWENSAEPAKSKTVLVEAHEVELSKYFSKSLVDLIRKDNICMARTGGICNLDFDPIYASQDSEATDIKISEPDKNNRVKVQFRYPSTHQLIKIQYKMVRTNLGWRINDVCYSTGSCLRKLLSRK